MTTNKNQTFLKFRNVTKSRKNNLVFWLAVSDKCPGDCIADRIADYCEAYLKSSRFCGTGKKCCVTKDADYNLEDIVIPTTFKIDNVTEINAENINKNKKKSKPSQKIITTTPDPDSSEEKLCKGECVAGLFALFCDDIDSDAFCPGEASCCVKADEDSNNLLDEKSTTTTTVQPPRTKAPSKSTTKVSLQVFSLWFFEVWMNTLRYFVHYTGNFLITL